MEDQAAGLRDFYARFVTARAGLNHPRLQRAFAAVPREPFAGPKPWLVPTRDGYVAAPEDDPVFLYRDVVIALDAAQGIHSGKPSLHAHLLAKLAVQTGQTVLHIGAGTGYYTAILAELVGAKGHIHAYEIDPGLAARAAWNLKDYKQIEVIAAGEISDLLSVDAIYVNAAATGPSQSWLDALKPQGRLIFPLQGTDNFGAMLLVTRPRAGLQWPAELIGRAGLTPCLGNYDAYRAGLLTEAFRQGNAQKIRSLRFDAIMPETCWFSAGGWWLST